MKLITQTRRAVLAVEVERARFEPEIQVVRVLKK
jgi:hypothetical protein